MTAAAASPPVVTARTVVVGVDGSESSKRALSWAARQAARTGAPLLVAAAWTMPASSWGVPVAAYVDPADLEEAARRLVQAAIRATRSELGDGAPVIQSAVLPGPAPDALLGLAAHASTLVVGSRGRGGFASLTLGSVATACAHHTPVPLVVVPGDAGTPDDGTREVVVGVDDSAGGRAALRWAAAQAAAAGIGLRIVHASILMDPPPRPVPPADPADRTPAEQLRAALDQVVADEIGADAAGLPATVVTVPLPATEALLQESKDASMLVVGSRGRGGFLGLRLGSVSEKCLHHVTCPIVIVPS